MPTQVLRKRFYTIASEANLGIPFLGKILPALGALTVPTKVSQTKEFLSAIKVRLKEKRTIIVYPEGHVWPYYTEIRPFKEGSFKFQAMNNVPGFCMTVTYYKRKNREKPGIKIYIDGPFIPDENLNLKQREKKLSDEVYSTMNKRCKNSDYRYIEYIKR